MTNQNAKSEQPQWCVVISKTGHNAQAYVIHADEYDDEEQKTHTCLGMFYQDKYAEERAAEINGGVKKSIADIARMKAADKGIVLFNHCTTVNGVQLQHNTVLPVEITDVAIDEDYVLIDPASGKHEIIITDKVLEEINLAVKESRIDLCSGESKPVYVYKDWDEICWHNQEPKKYDWVLCFVVFGEPEQQWCITRDFGVDADWHEGLPSRVGVVGGADATLTADQIKAHKDSQRFRMYDDDGVLHFEGYFVGEDEFAPLDDFGTADVGATRIDYYNKKTRKFETL